MSAHLSRGAVAAKTSGARRWVHRRGLVSRRLVDVLHRDRARPESSLAPTISRRPPRADHLRPSEEYGLVVEKDGRSIISAVGVHESSIWIHDAAGERPCRPRERSLQAIRLRPLDRTIKPSTTFCGIRTQTVARNSGA